MRRQTVSAVYNNNNNNNNSNNNNNNNHNNNNHNNNNKAYRVKLTFYPCGMVDRFWKIKTGLTGVKTGIRFSFDQEIILQEQKPDDGEHVDKNKG